jgi:hypothetical protein
LIHFDFENRYEDERIVGRAISAREAVLLSIIVHLLAIILFQYGPDLNFFRPSPEEVEARRQELLRKQELDQANRRFVFVQPQVDMKAPEPKPNVDLSDIDRRSQAPSDRRHRTTRSHSHRAIHSSARSPRSRNARKAQRLR